jgi:hypothetical protein
MTRLILSLSLLVAITATHAAEPAAVPLKAVKVAKDFMALLFNEKPEAVEISPVKAEGAFAEVQAKTPARTCSITLQQNATANPDGWVVSMHTCKPAAGAK